MKPIAVAALAALFAAPLAAQDIETRPYIFTQGHNGEAQTVDVARIIQVQLPSNTGANGDPVVDWQYQPEISKTVELVDTHHVASPGRIEGFDQVSVLDFRLTAADEARIVITTDSGNLISETGVYVIDLKP